MSIIAQLKKLEDKAKVKYQTSFSGRKRCMQAETSGFQPGTIIAPEKWGL